MDMKEAHEGVLRTVQDELLISGSHRPSARDRFLLVSHKNKAGPDAAQGSVTISLHCWVGFWVDSNISVLQKTGGLFDAFSVLPLLLPGCCSDWLWAVKRP